MWKYECCVKMHTLLEIHKFIHHVHGLNAHVSIKSWIFMLKLKLLCTLRKIVCWLEKNTFMLVTKSDRTVCWESSFCLTLIAFVIQFCQLLKIHIAVCNWLLERCNQSCEMSILLHGAKSLNYILPQEKSVNRDNFGTLIEQN